MIQVQNIRKELNISQFEMAILLETSLKTLQGWEQGRSMPKKMQKLLRVIMWFNSHNKLDVYKNI